MNEDATNAEDVGTDVQTDIGTGDEAAGEDVLDKYDEAVIAADDTGMLAAERTITAADIEQGLEGGLPDETGDV